MRKIFLSLGTAVFSFGVLVHSAFAQDYIASSTSVFDDVAASLWEGFLGVAPTLLQIAAGIIVLFWGWGKIKRHGFRGSKG